MVCESPPSTGRGGSTTVNGTDLTKVYRNSSQYFATFRNDEGEYLAAGTMVRFNINGVFYNRTTDEKGTAKLNINLNAGEYILTAINPETGEQSSNIITVLAKIVENNDITKYYRNGTQYTVKVLGDDGKVVGAGEIVTFNINGVFYNRTTDENGTAQLNINLQPGDYVITAEYQGFVVSNNIKVLPTLTAQDLTKTYGTSDQFIANLVDGQGNPLENQTIEFNINGVMYNRTTDSQGNSKLNINLGSGEYIITSRYNDAVIGNIVKVNA
ncbi:MAG: Ig-like domain repeat protein [Methanobrevibacter sp.]|uniref:Ig-like domain repeat protein n=1 Tax=Methanobrevibacter sp. TaxID=66852 RepID=UPI0025FFC2B9|nr:Ig-like domain repeat protein [Methanobrevibacter sp.]MBR0271687.1 Ig-like domain repeat protein [Methanobrevibacter sp.]